jgi:16S rRNA processing protein RimM
MLLTVGRIARPHGIHGEVVVIVRTDFPEQRFGVGAVLQTDPTSAGPLTLESVRPHHDRLIVRFAGIPDRTAAEALRDVLLCVDSADLSPPADPDEYLDHQLVGLAAVTPVGEVVGEVVAVEHAPASDLLVVRRPAGQTALVPFVVAIVPEVDLVAGRVVLTPPDGLLDL